MSFHKPLNCKPQKSALLVVDLCGPKMKHTFASFLSDPHSRTVQRMGHVISKTKELDIPTIFLCYVRSNPDPLLVEIASSDSIIILKSRWNGFENPELHEYLRSKNITNLIIGGFNQFQCVAETTEGALAHGYSVMVSDSLMYGHHYDRIQKRKSLKLYKKYCTYFYTIRGLLNSLE